MQRSPLGGVRKTTKAICLDLHTKNGINAASYPIAKAFTLIELLVVVSIIGVFAAATVVSLSGTQNAAEDAARKHTLTKLRTVSEIFYQSPFKGEGSQSATDLCQEKQMGAVEGKYGSSDFTCCAGVDGYALSIKLTTPDNDGVPQKYAVVQGETCDISLPQTTSGQFTTIAAAAIEESLTADLVTIRKTGSQNLSPYGPSLYSNVSGYTSYTGANDPFPSSSLSNNFIQFAGTTFKVESIWAEINRVKITFRAAVSITKAMTDDMKKYIIDIEDSEGTSHRFSGYQFDSTQEIYGSYTFSDNNKRINFQRIGYPTAKWVEFNSIGEGPQEYTVKIYKP